MDNGNGTTITVQDLTRKFGNFTAVDQVSFDVYPGEIFGFLGPNGSGKTTTIRMMLGLLPPTSGKAWVLGVPVHKQPSAIRPRVGYMSQRFSLYNDLTVLQNLQFYGKAYGLGNAALKERIGDALVMAGLTGKEHSHTKDLSGGWRQRLALSVAIIHSPEVIFLDEPTAGVDPVSRRAFWDLLYELVAEGVTIFVTTHYMDEAEHCHRLGFIHQGKIIGYGAPQDIKDRAFNGQVLELTCSDPAGAITILQEAAQSQDLPLENVELFGSSIHINSQHIKKTKKHVTRLLKKHNIKTEHTAIIEPSLEDVFIASVQNHQNQD